MNRCQFTGDTEGGNWLSSFVREEQLLLVDKSYRMSCGKWKCELLSVLRHKQTSKVDEQARREDEHKGQRVCSLFSQEPANSASSEHKGGGENGNAQW